MKTLHLMKAFMLILFSFLITHLTVSNNVNAQGTVVTSPPVNGTTQWGAITFNIQAAQSIIVDTIYVNTSGSVGGTVDLEIWYNPTPINGQPVPFTGAPWVNVIVAQNLPAGVNLAPIYIPGGLSIPAGSNWGFYIGNPTFATTGLRYGSSSSSSLITDGVVSIEMGTNVGYGWVRNTSSSGGNHPRYFAGGVSYNFAAACAGMPVAGTSVAPVNVCSGENFSLSLTGNTSATDLTYQWLSSASATGPWTPINGATVLNSVVSQSVDTYYACKVTCTNSSMIDTSAAILVQTFNFTAPFYEGFDTGNMPSCWESLSSNVSTSVNNFWKFAGQAGYGASSNGKAPGTFAWVDGDSPYGDSVMLITPEIDISQLTTPYLSFEWFSNNTNNPGDNVPMIIEVHDGTSWNFLDTLRSDSPDWEFVNYDLGAYMNSTIKVRFMVNKSVTTSYSYYNDILLDEVRIDDCISLGGQDGLLDICRIDGTINLNDNIIVKPTGGGEWSFPGQESLISQDSIFTVTYLPSGSYDVYYVERFVCFDTTFATINVFDPSSAGNDGSLSVCKNEPLDLFSALSGNIDMGGKWYDFTSTLLSSPLPKAQAIPGQYNYIYIADNGVCPADTAIVEVGVRADCDFLSLSEEMFADISVYPNPATSQLNIVNPSNTSSLKLEILDLNGRIVLVENKALNNVSEATLVIDQLERGIYTLRVYNNEGQKTFKIVKQ